MAIAQTFKSSPIQLMALFAVLVLTCGFIGKWSSDKPKPLSKYTHHNPSNKSAIDHSAWATVLKKYVRSDKTGLNRFSYRKVSKQDRELLKRYIAELSRVDITKKARRNQLAFWINLYNAVTIDIVLDHYPVRSIRDIDISGVFANGPWGKPVVSVSGKKLSLDDIEHRILRPIWRDPRIHYAVNCASIGCPNLQKNAFTAKNAEKMLDRGARQFINSSRGLSVKAGKITVSKIYQWFAFDFGNSETGVMNHLLKYADKNRSAALRKADHIDASQYDWSIND